MAMEDDISQWIESYGIAVESVDIIRDRTTGNSRGFCFVEVRDIRSDEAIAHLNGMRMSGRPITVNDAKPVPHGAGGQRYAS
jgi:RNA recognition motif-containing protein